ncbi:unnamed protein product [Allacma fusca]|uniref:Uncharacterized protein n=1 Tax=Allacma fusca TaxID=39272 RepID=A0A8J2K270_9HEXA|nr:unnamed protein product [Allacma fusca]
MQSRIEILEIMQVAANLIKSMHQTYTNFGIPLYYLVAYLYRFVYHIIQREREGVSYQHLSLAVIWELKSPATCSAEAKLRIQQFGDRFIGLGSSPETRFTKPEKQFMAEYIRQNGFNLALLRRNPANTFPEDGEFGRTCNSVSRS